LNPNKIAQARNASVVVFACKVACSQRTPVPRDKPLQSGLENSQNGQNWTRNLEQKVAEFFFLASTTTFPTAPATSARFLHFLFRVIRRTPNAER